MKMKLIYVLVFFVTSMQAYNLQQTKSLIQDKNPNRIQLIFEITKHRKADPQIWDLIKKLMLQLYIPELSSEEAIDAWLEEFSKMVKSIARISQKTKATHGNITIRFITD